MQIAIEAVLIETSDIERLAALYRQGFGLALPQPAADGQLGSQIGDVYLGFDPAPQPATPPGAMSLGFHVDDTQATFDHLVHLGATIKSAPQSQGTELIAIVSDPDGNTICLISAT
jgi:predicted enzyme related to lactoylglutathione lyase